MNKPIPCPYCGNSPIIEAQANTCTGSVSGYHAPIGCSCFEDESTFIFVGEGDTEEEAIVDAVRKWNHRHTPWQPMETAPKDGRKILVRDKYGIPRIVYWHPAYESWSIDQDTGISGLTLWLPLPPAPEAKP